MATDDRCELVIGGMTCASCAARIAEHLNGIDGVEASVNYATEKARVTLTADISAERVIAAVEEIGYSAKPVVKEATTSTVSPADTEEARHDADLRAARNRVWIVVVLAVPVIAMSMWDKLQFEYWQWACLALCGPVVVWGAWPFHRAAFQNLRHGAATMDTLISVGTLSALLGARSALSYGVADRAGQSQSIQQTNERTYGSGNKDNAF